MVKNLTHFHIYLPSQGQFQGWDEEATHSVCYWLNREICNSALGVSEGSSTPAMAFVSRRPTHLGRNVATLAAR